MMSDEINRNDAYFETLALISMLLQARAELEAARAAYLQHLAQVQPLQSWRKEETHFKQITKECKGQQLDIQVVHRTSGGWEKVASHDPKKMHRKLNG